MTQPQGYPPGVVVPAKKTSPVVWVLAGCGTLFALGGVAVAIAVWWGYQKAKSYADDALHPQSGVVQLWSDVPPLEGMTQSQETEMPLAIRAIARPFLDAMMRGLNNGKEAGHWDVAFYILKDKTTRDVEAFYVPARMGKFGWKQQGGCANVSETAFCSFQKREGDKGVGLLLIAAQDPQNRSTALYFMRGEAQETGNPSSGQ